MPELPEVETIKRGLQKSLIGHHIKSVEVRAPKLFIGQPKDLSGQTVLEIERRAKIMVWKLSKQYLVMHLKMTGQLVFVPKKGEQVVGGHPDKAYDLELPHKHSHIIFQFDNGTLYFNDLRKFGWVKVVDSAEAIKPLVATIGPEYNWPEFNLEYFTKQLDRRKNTTIKQALLDQTLVAGIGNIYADESLFLAKTRPTRKISTLKPAEIATLFAAIPTVFEKSLKHGGTSSQHYRQSDGKMGTYLKVANVYKREGEPCKVCGHPIERIKISGRSSHFCPHCQK